MKIFNHPVYEGCLYGVELEIEAEGLYENREEYDEESQEYCTVDAEVPRGWEWREEHSVCGPEVVFAKPEALEESFALIRRLFADIDRQGFAPGRSPRGSTHVHVNVSDLTYEQLKSFVMACAWAEPLLIEAAGLGRKGNLFAMSYANAPVGWFDIINSVRNSGLCLYNDTHYMAVNFRQIQKHGSVEFRMGPAMRNADEAMSWLSLISMVAASGRESVVTGREPPAFFEYMLKLLPGSAQERARKQAEKQAQEIWMRINAPAVPYTAPVPAPAANSATMPVTPNHDVYWAEFPISEPTSPPNILPVDWQPWAPVASNALF